MPRQRKLLGKRPGGNFAGIPGNLGPQRGFGDAFKKVGAWGILNPNEWMGFGKRQGLVESVLRPQYSLQEVISGNINIESEKQRARSARARERIAPAPVQEPTPPGQIPRRRPESGATATPVGAKTPSTPKAAPKATPKTGAAKTATKTPAPVAAIRKVPLKRGR